MPGPRSEYTLTKEMEDILSRVRHLRPLPDNVARILDALDDPDASPSMVAGLLALDQALTAYVLRAANANHGQNQEPCSSLYEAVTRLGFKQVHALVLSTVATGSLASRLSGYRLGNGQLWEHSVATAGIARWLAQALDYPAPEEAYVAGLLHDIGKLLLDQFVNADYHEVIESMWKRKQHLWQIEKRLFGIDHAEAGGLMCAEWNFPPALVDAIRCHHAPGQARSRPALAAIVNVANAFAPADSLGLSSMGGRMIHPDSRRILDRDIPALERIRFDMLDAEIANEMALVSPPASFD